MSDRASHTYDITDVTGYTALSIEVNGFGCDTVLLVNAADGGWHYNDDTHGVNPRVLLYGAGQMRGTVSAWVGTYNQGTCHASVSFRTYQ